MRSHGLLRPFPSRVPPLPGESLASLVRRTAQAMGYEGVARVMALLRERGRLPPHLNQLAPGPVNNYLAALLHQSPETISSLTVHACAPSLVLVPKDRQSAPLCDSQTILRYFSSSWPICPACFAEDDVPYERLHWSFRPVPVCVEHGCILISQCPACRRPLHWDRQDVLHCRCGLRLSDVEPLTVSSHALPLCRKLHQALRGAVPLLADMSTAACFWWMDSLSAEIGRTSDLITEAVQRVGLTTQHHEDAITWLAAAEILSDWPQRFAAFLDVFQQVDKHKTTSTGVGRRFGMVLRHAATLERRGHSAPAVVLRKYLVERYAAGHLSGKVCLFQTPKDRAVLRQRDWIPQTLAAKILGRRHGAVAKLIEEGVLQGRLHPAGRNGRSVGLVRKTSVATLQAELRDALDVPTAARRLGIDRHRVLDLIHDRMLPRAVRTATGWRIPRAAVAELENLCQRLRSEKSASRGWISLRQATRMFGPTGLTLALLIEWVQTEKVSARMADPEKRLNGIMVSHADFTALLPEIRSRRDQQRGYPVHRLGKALFPDRPIKCSVIKKWIAARLLKVRKSGRARMASPAEVDRFHREYCLAEEACQALGITRSTLSRWEVEGLVQPVYGKRVTPGAGFSLYRRADLAGLSRRRAA